GDAGRAVFVGFGQLLDGPRRPPGVQPADVASQDHLVPPRPSRRAAHCIRYGDRCGSVSAAVAFATMLELIDEIAQLAQVPVATVTRPRNAGFGDLQVTAAMGLAKEQKRAPREIAEEIAQVVR